MLRAFGISCVACDTVSAIEAAHIRDRRFGGVYLARNGIPLCRPCHKSFDKHDLGVTPQGAFIIAAGAPPQLARVKVGRPLPKGVDASAVAWRAERFRRQHAPTKPEDLITITIRLRRRKSVARPPPDASSPGPSMEGGASARADERSVVDEQINRCG